MTKITLSYVTTKNKDEALHLGRLLLEEKLAACVNIIDGMQSMYWWDGKIETSSEAVLLVKTRADLVDKMTAFINEKHSYDVPCVLTLDVGKGNQPYIDWLMASLK